MVDLPQNFIILPGQSQEFILSFSPAVEGKKEAAICFHYITERTPIGLEIRRGGQNIYGIQGTGTLLSANLPVSPKWALIFIGSLILGLGSYLISRRM
jgi:hypothetical protein